MMEKAIVKCAKCGKSEEYLLKPGYPRKYCSVCAAEKKAEYEAKEGNITPQAERVSSEPPKAQELAPTREQSIVAQCLTKCFSEVLAANASMTLEQANTVRTGILETYKFYLKSL